MPRPKCNCGLDNTLYNGIRDIIKTNGLCWIHPNIVTLSSIALLYSLFISFQENNVLRVIIIIIIRTLLDYVDGELARNCNTGSKLGSYLDSISDILGHSLVLYYIFQNILGWRDKFSWQRFSTCFIVITAIMMSNSDPSDHIMKNYTTQFLHDNMITCTLVVLIIWMISLENVRNKVK